jgi:hypothetical protein
MQDREGTVLRMLTVVDLKQKTEHLKSNLHGLSTSI